MKLEKLTENEKIEELGYTKYDAFLGINNLLVEELGKRCEKEKAGDKSKDEYLEDALEDLGTLLAAIRGRYERNGIKFEEKDVFSYKEIQMFSEKLKDLKEAYKFGLNELQLEALIRDATSRILQGIETTLSAIPPYNPKYKSKELDKSIKGILVKVKEYAQIGTKLGDILTAMEMERKGLLVKTRMEQLTKTQDLMKKIKNEDMYKVIRPVIDMHAEIYGLPFNGNSSAFIGESGEKTEWVMILAKLIADHKEITTESQVAGRKKFLGANLNGEICIHRDAEYRNKLVKKDGLAPAIAELISQDPKFEWSTYKVKSPFESLEDKLNSLGIGYELAKRVSQYLSEKMLCRGTTGFKNIKQEEMYELLTKNIECVKSIHEILKNDNLKKEDKDFLESIKSIPEDELETELDNEQLDKLSRIKNDILPDRVDKYAIAMKMLIEKLSGKKIPNFAFSYFKKEEAYSSNAISGWVLVSEKGRNGKSKIIHEDQRNRNLEEILETVKKQFTKKEQEILVTENVGVCFTFDFLAGYTVTSNFKSLIEVQNSFEEVSRADKLAGLFYKTSVIAHEITHASQINSRLMWRNMAMSAAASIAETALKWHKEGKLDYETPEGKNCFKKQTYGQDLVDFLEGITAQALGLGEEAEVYRQKGIYDAIIEKGAVLRKDGKFNPEHFSKIKLERSKTAKLSTKIKQAIESNDIKALRNLKKQADEYKEELSTMVETMAETFGITATQDFIKNYPRKISEKEKQEYAKALRSGIINLGVRGEEFTRITSKYKEPNEKMEKELNKKGLTYKRILTKYGDTKPVEEKLIKIGYHPLYPTQAYEDMQELEKRVKEYNKTAKQKIELKDIYYPLNNGRAQLDIRYRKNIPMYMKVVEKYGPQKAHELMLNAESLKEIEKLVR